MNILGIETSCDETGIAIYSKDQGILAHAVYSQTDTHSSFGGVVPELASRDHVRKVMPLIKEVLSKAKIDLKDISGIAYTKGPGLAGALLIGAMFARTLGYALNVPTIGVHHLEGHLLAPFLEDNSPEFPFLSLLVSGGHTQLITVEKTGAYQIIGDTLDDAAGEAFDKTAKLLGLGYPGGALLQKLAEKGNPNRFLFPRPMVGKSGLDFSFSGLKTFALHTFNAHREDQQAKADIAYAFQAAIVDTLVIKCKRALKKTRLNRLVIAGGVSANAPLRKALNEMAGTNHIQLYFPRLEFCTDNGAMIAYAGFLRLSANQTDDLSVEVYSRWPLDQLSAI